MKVKSLYLHQTVTIEGKAEKRLAPDKFPSLKMKYEPKTSQEVILFKTSKGETGFIPLTQVVIGWFDESEKSE